MRVFPDTNVFASAFGTRGLCADVLRLILSEHQLITGEVVLEELRRVLSRKFGGPADTVQEIENFLRGFHVEPRPSRLLGLDLKDRNDQTVVTSALNAKAEVVVTGDREMLALKGKPKHLRILNPREFWNLATRFTPRKRPQN